MSGLISAQRAMSDSSSLTLEQCLGAIAGTIGLLLFLWLRLRHKRRRDATLATQWDWMMEQARLEGRWLAHVDRVYQPAAKGCKAYLAWWGTDQLQDTWFWYRLVDDGTYVLVKGRTGWGPHNRNPQTFYVHPEDLLATVSGEAPSAWQRHRSRAVRASRRHWFAQRLGTRSRAA